MAGESSTIETDEQGPIIKCGNRHPIIEGDMVNYASAIVLGRVTVGRGASIGERGLKP